MAPENPVVHVIIVSFKDKEAVSRCVRSVLASSYSPHRVIVVDNASGDGSVEELETRFPDCRFVAGRANLGFGGGCNAGIEIAVAEGSEFLLLLNQDTVVEPDLIRRLVAFMEAHPRAGAVGAKTYSTESMSDGAPKRLYAGAWRTFLPLIQNIPGIEQADTEWPEQPVKTDYVWGHGMMLRAAAVAEVGLLDPAFFMYCEDLDLCRRMRSAGYEIWCEPRALMWHDVPDGARADRSEYWRWVLKVRSMGVFHRKHYSRVASGVLTLLTVLVESKRLVQRRRVRAARHLLRAYAASLVRLEDIGSDGPRDSVGAGDR